MPKVEGVRWSDLDDAASALFSRGGKAASRQVRPTTLDSFDFDGTLNLVARLQKAAAAAVAGDEDDAPPPFEKKDEKPAEPPFEKKKDDSDSDDDTEKVASAAVMRQTLVDVCHLLAGYEPALDKTAGVIALGLLDGHSGRAVTEFVGGMSKEALRLPWSDLPAAGLVANVRRAVYRTPEERVLQSEANFARSEAAAQRAAGKFALKNEALNLDRAAQHAPADAIHRSSQIQGLLAAGLDRPTAERTLKAQADAAAQKSLAAARKSMGLDSGKIPVSLGSINTNVSKRLFSRTAPLALGALGAGYLLGHRGERDQGRGRGITIT